jgi:hypothetical protein
MPIAAPTPIATPMGSGLSSLQLPPINPMQNPAPSVRPVAKMPAMISDVHPSLTTPSLPQSNFQHGAQAFADQLAYEERALAQRRLDRAKTLTNLYRQRDQLRAGRQGDDAPAMREIQERITDMERDRGREEKCEEVGRKFFADVVTIALNQSREDVKSEREAHDHQRITYAAPTPVVTRIAASSAPISPDVPARVGTAQTNVPAASAASSASTTPLVVAPVAAPSSTASSSVASSSVASSSVGAALEVRPTTIATGSASVSPVAVSQSSAAPAPNLNGQQPPTGLLPDGSRKGTLDYWGESQFDGLIS